MQLQSNHASGESPNGYGNQYLYDGEGRICAVATPKGMFQYLYDADGTRVAKGTIQLVNNALSCDTTQNQFRLTASYILDLGGQQLTELDWTSGTAQWAHTNVWAAGQLIATYSTQNRQGILNFYFDDWLGSRRVMTDDTGNVQETCHSLPYGNGEDCGPVPTEHLFTGKERDTESGNDYFGARYYASSMGRFLSPDPLYIEMHRLADPQQLNLYMYGRNNPLTVTDPTGLDITCGGTRCADYLAALQKDVSFKIDYDKNGKVETVGDIDKKSLSKSDKQFLKAIDDTKHHVTINAIDGGKDSSVFFGRSDGNHTGSHTIAFDQAGLLDSAKNAGGMTSASLIGHETLEGYGESQGWGPEASHNWANGLGFPGFDPGKIMGLYGNAQTNTAFGFTQQFQVYGTNTTENIRINFVTPIPAASVHSGMNAAGYPVSVEKAQ